jgi:hypothetical protein
MLGGKAGFLAQLAIHCFERRFVGPHAALRELPTIITRSLRPENAALIVHQNDGDIWPVTVGIDHCFR